MAQKSKGLRRKTRKKLTKEQGRSGTISTHLHPFDEGEQVLIDIDPSIQQGMPHPRFHGRTAIVAGKRGRSYEILVKDGGKEKEFTVHPAHIRELEQE